MQTVRLEQDAKVLWDDLYVCEYTVLLRLEGAFFPSSKCRKSECVV